RPPRRHAAAMTEHGHTGPVAKECVQRVSTKVNARMARRLIFVKPDGIPCTTRSGERANSGAPPVLVAFGDCDAVRLREFAAEHGGALVERWRCSEARRCERPRSEAAALAGADRSAGGSRPLS